MRFKAVIIVLLIILSLLPVYMLYKYLEKVMRPKESVLRFLGWMVAVLALIFVYTFLVVFVIQLVFPGA
ncbi:MAG: hypothetical protein ABL876_13935 [Chitinophagaceae bacterium]